MLGEARGGANPEFARAIISGATSSNSYIGEVSTLLSDGYPIDVGCGIWQ